jgi:hypothetical protein
VRIVIGTFAALAAIATGIVIVVVQSQCDLTVLNEVDGHSPWGCFGCRRDQDLLADLEERGRHPVFIGSIRHG